ncbi:MAG: C40 family peptidase [Chitinophagales bacterium]|nr:C40 family peptidase [Chitinophagales bacterium]
MLVAISVVCFCAIAQDALSVSLPFPSDLDSLKVDSFFQKHSIDLAASPNPELYFEVYRWYRTCYRYGGSGEKGIDCSGFTNMLYEKVYGQKIPRASYLIYDVCQPLDKKDEKREGDFVFFKIRKKRISHVGVYLQNNKFAHASTQAGVIISDLNEAYYKKYFFKAGRLKDFSPKTTE